MARKEEAMVELEIETLARRLDRVDRENRRLKQVGVVALAVIAAVVLLSPLLAMGLDVNEWKQLGKVYRIAYIAGAADATHHIGDMLELDLKAGTHLLVKSLVDVSNCLVGRNMKTGQVVAIVEKYVKENPEYWNLPMGGQTWTALVKACDLTGKK